MGQWKHSDLSQHSSKEKWPKGVVICIWIKRGQFVDQAATHNIHFMSALRIMFANIVGGSRQQSELWVRFPSPQISYTHTPIPL